MISFVICPSNGNFPRNVVLAALRRFYTIHYVSCGVAQWAGPHRGCPGAKLCLSLANTCSVATGRMNASFGREL